MDKLDKHLHFLKELNLSNEENTAAAFAQNKRNIRTTIHQLLKPQESLKNLTLAYKNADAEEQLRLITKVFQHFIPNPQFKQILDDIHKRKIKANIDTESLEKLKKFTVNPQPEELKILFDYTALKSQNWIKLFQYLQHFAPLLHPWCVAIEAFAEEKELELSFAAIRLLGQCQYCVQHNLNLWARLFQDPEKRFVVLSSLSSLRGLSVEWLYVLFHPIFEEYKRLTRIEKTTLNSLWQEVNLMRNILKNNGAGDRILWLEIGID